MALDSTDAAAPPVVSPGRHLGPYELVERIGAGGMGEIWRARDTRLERAVAVKVLPAPAMRDPEALRRFELEARAVSALNHPAILTVHDVGSDEGVPYVVFELLEGQTLRAALAGGPLPLRRVLEIGREIAGGLAAAHRKGVVHRDLKPENVFLVDGRVKLLDFGLAKLLEPGPSGELVHTATGAILGTAPYMSPEQVRGEPVDARSDIFSLGALLHELLSGRRAFAGGTAADVMAAILNSEPPSPAAPNAVARIVAHCLEKSPEARFQAAADVAFALATVEETAAPPPPRAPRRRRLLAVGLALLGGGVAAGLLVARATTDRRPAAVTVRLLTFRRGPAALLNARFAPDGRSIVYSADWNDGDGATLYRGALDAPEAQPIPIPGNFVLLSVLGTGELAVLRVPGRSGSFAGMLARVPIGGGTPRDVIEGVEFADWTPGGDLAVVRRAPDGLDLLELPLGTVLYRSSGYLSGVRVAPGGDAVAIVDHPDRGDDRGALVLVDRRGRARKLTRDYAGIDATAWAPSGEVWFTAADVGAARALRAATRDGRERMVMPAPGRIYLFDVAADGRALFSNEPRRMETYALAPGAAGERPLSWFDASIVLDITDDGKTVLIQESGEAASAGYRTYLRATDGSPPVWLARGTGTSIAPDGRTVLVTDPAAPDRVLAVPTGPGEARLLLQGGPLRARQFAVWFPDGKRILTTSVAEGHGQRLFVEEPGGEPRPIAPEGVGARSSHPISPDGRWVAALAADGWHRYPVEVDGGEPRPIAGLAAGERVARWTPDGRLLVYNVDRLPCRVSRLDPDSGAREPVREIVPSDPNARAIRNVQLTPDGGAYAYSYAMSSGEIYLAEGLR